jgi:putative redox protein
MSQTIGVSVTQTGSSTSVGRARDHEVAIDRPESKGGTDRGPMGGELLLLGLGGCLMSNLLEAIRVREATVSDVRFSVEGVLEGTPNRIVEVTVGVTARYEDRELMEKLLLMAERACLVANSLRGHIRLTTLLIDPGSQGED